jgi:hypothetical protein
MRIDSRHCPPYSSIGCDTASGRSSRKTMTCS